MYEQSKKPSPKSKECKIVSEITLIVTGRCISASFILQASMRIQPTCMSIGEAAGIAAAWGIKHKIAANVLKWEEIPEDMRSYISAGEKK